MGTMMACTLPDVIRLVISSKKDQKIFKIVNKYCFILKTAAKAVASCRM